MIDIKQGCIVSEALIITFLETEMRLAQSCFYGDVTIDGLKIIDLRLMDDIDLISECYDESKPWLLQWIQHV